MVAVVSFHYSNFGKRVTDEFIKSLEAEVIEYDSGKVWLTFSLQDFKGRGMYCGSLKKLSRGRLIITKNRIVGIASKYKLLDVPKNHELYNSLQFDKSEPKRFKIFIDLSLFPAGLQGMMKMSYHIKTDPFRSS